MTTRTINIKRGLDLPIVGGPTQEIESGSPVRRVALVGPDYVGMKPTMQVREGDLVRIGQVLFSDKKTPGLHFTSPAGGTVVEVNRGAKRAFLSVVIEVSPDEAENAEQFLDPAGRPPQSFSPDEVVRILSESGLWSSFRMRPFSKVPPPDTRPQAIFVTAIDTNPLAGSPAPVIARNEVAFRAGLLIVEKLVDGPVYVCTAPGASVPVEGERVEAVAFDGPHPAGLAGTHIHFLHPVSSDRTVWHVGYQDVIAIGKLFATGRLDVSRVVSLAGPGVQRPRLVETRLGASLDDLCAGELHEGPMRVISGSVLWGRAAQGPLAYLGRYHNQVSVLSEAADREFLAWLAPGTAKFSVKPAFLSRLFRGRRFALNTALNGSSRAMVPTGSFEQVMPLDIEPTFLLRALIVEDTDQAQALGCLELDEEDLGLCTFACTGKYDYGQILRDNLTKIEKEG